MDTGGTIGENFDRGKWRVVKVTGQKPAGRYDHMAAVIEDKMLVFSGNSGGSNLLVRVYACPVPIPAC